MTPLEECVVTFRRWMHLPRPGALLVTLATVVANLGTGDPVWLLIIGPPGGGKTETLKPLSVLPNVHQAATLTVASLLSGTPKKERENGSKGGLLRVIGDEPSIIVLKDFTSVLSMHRDARAEVLAALREVFDGAWTRHVGTGGGLTLSWEGKVGLIGGCTPAIDSAHAVMGSMGERFVFYRLPPIDGEAQAAAALEHAGSEATMRAELSAAVARVLDGVQDKPHALTDEDKARINRLANLGARCRSAVERDPRTRDVELIPEPEAPARLVQVLGLLHRGLAAIGATDEQTWGVLTKVALDSMPAIRRTVLEAVAGDPGHEHSGSPSELYHKGKRYTPTTQEVARAVGYPNTTVHRALEDLACHGVLTRERQGSNRPDLWGLSAWTRERYPEMSLGVSTSSIPPQVEEKTFRDDQEAAA